MKETAYTLYQLTRLPGFKLEVEECERLYFNAGGFRFDGSGYSIDEALFHALIYLSTRIEFKRLSQKAFE